MFGLSPLLGDFDDDVFGMMSPVPRLDGSMITGLLSSMINAKSPNRQSINPNDPAIKRALEQIMGGGKPSPFLGGFPGMASLIRR